MSAVLRRVEAGVRLRVTVSGRPVAELVPLPVRSQTMSWEAFRRHVDGGLADPGLTRELAELLPDRRPAPAVSLSGESRRGRHRSGGHAAVHRAGSGPSPGRRAPRRVAVPVVTAAELHLGVLAAADPQVRARRLDTVARVEALEPSPVERSVAVARAALRVSLRDAGVRMPVNDSWIAATALSRGMPVVTQDADFDDVPGLAVIKL